MKYFAVVALLLVGCSSESPADKCEKLISNFCGKFSACFPSKLGNAQGGPYQDCITAVKAMGVYTCSSTTGVGPTYDECLSDLNTHACSTIFATNDQGQLTGFTPPSSCVDVIKH